MKRLVLLLAASMSMLAVMTNVTVSSAAPTQTLYAFGAFGERGPVGPINDTPITIDTSSLDAPIQQVVATNAATYILTTNHTLYSYGADGLGELGDGMTGSYTYKLVKVSVPEPIAWLPSVMPFATGVAIGESGTAYGWGDNEAGDLCLGNTSVQDTPQPITALGTVTEAAGAGGHTVWVTSKGVKACGQNQFGQLGNTKSASSDTPVGVKVLDAASVTDLYADLGTTAALVSGGALYMWGNGSEGQLGRGSTANSNVPVQVPLAQAVTAFNLGGNTASDGTAFATLANGAVKVWGSDDYGQACNGSIAKAITSPSTLDFPDTDTFVSGGATSYIIDASNTLWSCGASKEGAAGNGQTSGDQLTPFQVLIGVTSVSSESRNVAALVTS
jgi:alpha-tubulin suppressor-like RCC1 family protein